MASMNKITDIIGAIKTIYSYYAKDTDIVTLAKTWELLLKDYPDEAVDIAFLKCLQTCKVPPTPADVIEQLRAMIETTEPTQEELWSIYIDALSKTMRQMSCFGYSFVMENGRTQGDNARAEVEEIWNTLPDEIKSYLGSKSELMRMSQEYKFNNDLTFEKSRFLKTMPVIKKRKEYKEFSLLLGGGNLMIEKGVD